MRRKHAPVETFHPVDRVRPFPPRRDYASLSVKDLLDAREAYHAYLSTLDNVVGTAIGRYLIHEKDWYATHPPDDKRPPNVKKISEPRRLTNSIVRPWSWPAVLVFVRQWQKPKNLGNNVVPPTLYLSDGRVVPTCVVEARPDEEPGPPARAAFNSTLIGGGYSCLREHQGESSLGTFACLVTKGGSYYALTNRHVAGGDGEVVRAHVRNEYVDVGTTSDMAIERVPMINIFGDWAGPEVYLTVDAGLVKINDVRDWTSQAYGIGEIGDVFDATTQTVTLDLIDCTVRAFGGSSGVAEGQIRALFFRYQSIGGYEYVTDLLIGPRIDKHTNRARPLTRPGDSGTVWFYDPPKHRKRGEPKEDFPESAAHSVDRGAHARRLRPIAMQWGGQRIVDDGKTTSYALASYLSTISRELDVEIVRDWSTGHDEYWGKIGHFAIGWKACDEIADDRGIGPLFAANQQRIGFDNATLGEGAKFTQGRNDFVPLADVPDYVWIPMQFVRKYEPIQHFADIDIYGIDGGPTMLQRCIDEPKKYISAARWLDYFDGFAAKDVGPDEGCLPFRVWQIWEEMVGYLKESNLLKFVAAAGVLAHYVGDASQPLHCSYLHHGVPPMKKIGSRNYPIRKEDKKAYDAWKATRPAHIHGIYEETMLEVDAPDALEEIDSDLRRSRAKAIAVRSGFEAAKAAINLMARAQARLSPMNIVDADDPEEGPKARAKKLWANRKVRNATLQSLAESVQVLRDLWRSAWAVGKGSRIKWNGEAFEEKELEKLYRTDRTFLRSFSLKQLATSKRFEP